jgi:ribose-phosphate pyrophosphokinase
MTERHVFALPGNEALAARLTKQLNSSIGSLEIRKFPDNESYVRIASPVANGSSVALIATLDQPDQKIIPLLFAATALRELGAVRIGLVAPYLAYMRQDHQFKGGEAVTSRYFAALLSAAFDWLVTVDPHLHRYRSLSEIYTIPTAVAHAAPAIAKWITANVEGPFLVGPDIESQQWVTAVASHSDAPSSFLKKVRLSDREVELKHVPNIPSDRTPVLVDDIVSSGETALQAIRLIRTQTNKAPLCVAIHGLFSGLSDATIEAEGARVVCTTTVPGRHSQIDVSDAVAASVRAFL